MKVKCEVPRQQMAHPPLALLMIRQPMANGASGAFVLFNSAAWPLPSMPCVKTTSTVRAEGRENEINSNIEDAISTSRAPHPHTNWHVQESPGEGKRGSLAGRIRGWAHLELLIAVFKLESACV